MAKLSKFKYIIICLLALAVIASATIFSVSYAKWTGGNTQVTANGTTGVWLSLSQMSVKDIGDKINAAPSSGWGSYSGGYVQMKGGEEATKKFSWTKYGSKGYSVDMSFNKDELPAGFVVAIFGRVWLKDASINNGKGSCVLVINSGNDIDIYDYISLTTIGEGNNEIGKQFTLFTILKPCKFNVRVVDGNISGNPNNTGTDDDIVTISNLQAIN